MHNFVKKTLEVAREQEGVREEGGPNRGEMVERYLASAALGPGNPWCAAFVYWCSVKASQALGIPSPLPKTGSCIKFLNWAKKHDVAKLAPKAGDLFVVLANGGKGRAHHIGFVTSVSGNQFKTIEGNTNTDGSREGIGVFLRTRTAGEQYRFIRWGLVLSKKG